MQNKNLLEVMLRRKGKVLLDRIGEPTSDVMSTQDRNGYMELMPDHTKRVIIAATVAHNMSYLGYIPSKELLDAMMSDEKVSQKVNDAIIPVLKQLKGADVTYRPMYNNFPREVMESSLAELYINAILHYCSFGEWMPESVAEKRLPLNEDVKMKTIGIGTDKDCVNLLSNLMNSNIVYSAQDMDDINTLAKSFDIYNAMPNFIVNRENMATLTKMLYENAQENEAKTMVLHKMSKQVKSATDILRIANTVFGNGDATLSENITVGKMSRTNRRAILRMIENCPHIAEDMKINRKAWVRMGEILHPGEYSTKYPRAYDAFQSMRENKKAKTVKTTNSLAEKAMTSTNMSDIEEFAVTKPGVIARNLDRLLRNAEDPNAMLSIWDKVAANVAPALLWQVHAHFKRRCAEYNQEKLRIFVTKGLHSQTKVMNDDTKEIGIGYYEKVVAITEKALREIYKDKPEMGKVYIDPAIAECKIPNGTRDAQKGSVGLAKGSKIPMNANTNTLRAFVWWTNTKNERVDIDLSAALMDKDLKLLGRCSFYYMDGDGFCMSGDITNGGAVDGKGVAEFLDIDVEKVLKQGIRYVAFTIHSYTENTFSEMEHAHFGFMEREHSEEGEIFEPSTVKNLIKLNADSTLCTACMFDLEKRQLIWMDEVGTQKAYRRTGLGNTLDANWQGTAMGCYKALHLEKPNLSDVIRVNAEARNGTIVYDPKEADVIFSLNEGITPYDADFIAGELIPATVSDEYMPKKEETQINEEKPQVLDSEQSL